MNRGHIMKGFTCSFSSLCTCCVPGVVLGTGIKDRHGSAPLKFTFWGKTDKVIIVMFGKCHNIRSIGCFGSTWQEQPTNCLEMLRG